MNDRSPPANDPADRTTLRERRQRVLDEIAADAAASHDINDAIQRKVAPARAANQTAPRRGRDDRRHNWRRTGQREKTEEAIAKAAAAAPARARRSGQAVA